MSNQLNPEAARKQAEADARNNRGAADTRNWPAETRKAYDAAYNKNKK